MLGPVSRTGNKLVVWQKLTNISDSSHRRMLQTMSGEEELLPDFIEVADSNASKTKRRKSQSQEEFEAQKLLYKEGPVIQTEDVSKTENP